MTSESIYRKLLVLHPKPFRREFGDEMVQLFRDMRREGPGAFAWARAIVDLFASAIYERKEWLMSKKTGYALTAGALATAVIYTAVLVGVGGSVGAAAAVFGVVLAIAGSLVGVAALVGKKLAEPTERTGMRRNWWVPAPMLLALGYMIVALRPFVEGGSVDAGEVVPPAAFAGVMVFGLLIRFRRGGSLGPWTIAAASLPALPFIWFPPIPIVGVVAIVGALSEIIVSRRPSRKAAA